MFQRLYFSSRYGTYLHSEHGVKKFAEKCMGQLISKVTKKSAFYREMNENLLVEKANLRMRQDELNERALLDPGRFFSVRRRLMANSLIMVGVVIAAFFMYHISVMAFVTTDAGLSDFVRWAVAAVLALVLTGGGLILTERLIESLIPYGAEEEEAALRRKAVAVLWGVLLVGIELAILGITSFRASTFAQEVGSGLLLYGFVSLALLLPVIAGTIRWDAMQYIDAYKTTRAHRQIDGRLAQIDSILRQNEEYESNFYKMKSISYWDLLNEFKANKDVYNERHDIVESLSNHFAQSYDTFQAEANKRYQADIRDITSQSMRKLDMADRFPVGSKLGQAGARMRAVPESDSGGYATGRSEPEIYLSPKPVR